VSKIIELDGLDEVLEECLEEELEELLDDEELLDEEWDLDELEGLTGARGRLKGIGLLSVGMSFRRWVPGRKLFSSLNEPRVAPPWAIRGRELHLETKLALAEFHGQLEDELDELLDEGPLEEELELDELGELLEDKLDEELFEDEGGLGEPNEELKDGLTSLLNGGLLQEEWQLGEVGAQLDGELIKPSDGGLFEFEREKDAVGELLQEGLEELHGSFGELFGDEIPVIFRSVTRPLATAVAYPGPAT
jgi:hypothetical protein